MKLKSSMLDEVKILIPRKLDDERGFVSFPFEQELLKKYKIDFNIAQINVGYSAKKNTIRGCHYQEMPLEQAKLVYCLRGCIYSVAVDIRKNSPSFGLWKGECLSLENSKIMYIPKGFAHGYVSLEDETLIQWCVDEHYAPTLAKSLRYDDPDVAIKWPIEDSKLIISDKDRKAIFLKDLM